MGNEEIKFSIIIPAFNAEDFIEEAIDSALNQNETGEVLVINDGSTDSTELIVERIKNEKGKVRLLNHPDKSNKGVSESRNFGIQNAVYDYIAFLDADDYYLPDRFKNTIKIFTSIPEADGVYEAVGTYFQEESLKHSFKGNLLLSVKGNYSPEALFKALLLMGEWFSGDGLAVKKSIFNKTGFFNNDLKVSEDTEMWIKFAATARLFPGNLVDPVTIRRVHKNDSLTKSGNYAKYEREMFKSLVYWAFNNDWVNYENKYWLIERYLENMVETIKFKWHKRARKLVLLFALFIKIPESMMIYFKYKLND